MGYNRGGARRTARLKRSRREQLRLAKKAPATKPAQPAKGLPARVGHSAEAAATAVGQAVHKVVDTVRGKKSE
jgi:hypothetical protein